MPFRVFRRSSFLVHRPEGRGGDRVPHRPEPRSRARVHPRHLRVLAEHDLRLLCRARRRRHAVPSDGGHPNATSRDRTLAVRSLSRTQPLKHSTPLAL